MVWKACTQHFERRAVYSARYTAAAAAAAGRQALSLACTGIAFASSLDAQSSDLCSRVGEQKGHATNQPIGSDARSACSRMSGTSCHPRPRMRQGKPCCPSRPPPPCGWRIPTMTSSCLGPHRISPLPTNCRLSTQQRLSAMRRWSLQSRARRRRRCRSLRLSTCHLAPTPSPQPQPPSCLHLTHLAGPLARLAQHPPSHPLLPPRRLNPFPTFLIPLPRSRV